jgi:tRNA 2-selenouridine synthase
MSLRRITAPEAITDLQRFDALIDARSESEFAEDHLPGALNWPTLDDAQRHLIGTEYKQLSPFDARKRGAAMAARNIAAHIERHLGDKPKGWRPLVYCWRGGQRSGSLATVLDAIGFSVQVLEGGYREFRRAVLAELETLPQQLSWRVLCGRTGSAKSVLLQTLAREGAQVLDLEALASHKGSVLGPMPGQPQPTQKAFETQVWHALRGFDRTRDIFVESESRTIGRLRVPEALLTMMRAAPCVQVQMALDARVQFLLHDYAYFVADIEAFCEKLQALRELRGAAVVAQWQQQARAGQVAQVVRALLEQHYDPVYMRSMQRNFSGFEAALPLALADAQPASLLAAARSLITSPHVQTTVAGEVRPGGEA